MPKLYSEQFTADAVALVESGISRRQVCGSGDLAFLVAKVDHGFAS
ncbi:hypothetical protein QEV13_06445 [Trueperella pyogenes]|nr:hypothetical protein [Trueperella pyogenes]MBB3025572.1 hypothetical protein [Trueperella pyogenes]WHU60289.1 hypothetical protein QEV13_06445 [Trueperella pyogenes]SUO86454.1 Uncharacterised protein [Trueperella pyogenes]